MHLFFFQNTEGDSEFISERKRYWEHPEIINETKTTIVTKENGSKHDQGRTIPDHA